MSHFEKLAKAHSSTIVFKKIDKVWEDLHHNWPLYVEASLKGHKLRKALVDCGSGVNLLPYFVFVALGIPKERLRSAYSLLNTFQGTPVKVVGTIVVSLAIGPIKTSNVFQEVEESSNYHVLLGSLWIHAHNCVPSTLYQCIKSSFKGKDIEFMPMRRRQRLRSTKTRSL
ncbi:hypothetical protein L6164_002716 [Bauhinia variegata]|uniref:Uncharacterized protein n=1 Tax=Bauhinia variegata TaxID=167791 RepID=A0ACB9PY79_BAUVA|nr:hypothetical protein L6164_002716 [Bauhinia variegata]